MFTITEIAQRLDTPFYRVRYVVAARNIKPAHVAGAGRVRLFDEEGMNEIAAALNDIDNNKSRDRIEEVSVSAA